MSIPAKVQLRLRERVIVKIVCSTNPKEWIIKKFDFGARATTTGKEGACVLPVGILVPGIELNFSEDEHHPEIAMVPLNCVELV